MSDCIIPLTKGYFAVVDEADADLSTLKWCARNGNYPYAMRRITVSFRKSRLQVMHRLIMERKLGRDLCDGEQVDHINGDVHDNRRSNLRLATHAENHRNTKRPTTNKSGYKGVSWHKEARKWRATISSHGQWKHLGFFDTPQEAHRAYIDAAAKLNGDFARAD